MYPLMRFEQLLLAAAILLVSFQIATANLFYTAYRNSGVSQIDQITGQDRGSVALTTSYQQGFDDFVGLAVGPDRLLYVSSRYYGDSRFGRWGVFRVDPATGEQLGSFINDGPYLSIQFGPDGDLYGVSSWSDSLHRFDGVTGQFKDEILDGDDYGYYGVNRFAILPDGAIFAATGSSDIARYDLQTGEQIGSVTSLIDLGLEGYRYDGMAVGPDGRVYVAYNYRRRDQVLDGGILRFDSTTGDLLDVVVNDIPAFGAASGGAMGLAFGPDGDLYVGSQHASAILRYDPATGNLLQTLPIPDGITGAAYIVFAIPEPSSAGLALTASAVMFALRRWRICEASA